MSKYVETTDLGSEPIPITPFIDEAYFRREVENVFKKTWRNVGRVADDLPNAGDFFVKNFDTPAMSVIVQRGHDGRIRAFHNVCRHRGARLVDTTRGNCKHFICGFHGWTYDAKGRLVSISDERQFEGIDKSRCGLLEIPVDTWNGFIFVNLDPHPEQTLKDFLGEFAEIMGAFPHEKMVMTGHYEAVIECNWKSFWHAFMESYHAIFVHKLTLKQLMQTSDNPFTCLYDFMFLGRHNSAAVPANPDTQPNEMDLNVRSLAGNQLIGLSTNANECTAPINPSGSKNFMFRITQVFPNLALHMGDGFFYTYNMEPISVDKTRWTHKIYGYPPKTAAERLGAYYGNILLRDALLEDVKTLEPMHQAMKTGVLPHIFFGQQEACLRHHFMMVDQMVGGHTVGAH